MNITRTLLTESAAVFIPFRAQEIMDKVGIWYGQNAITNNPILCNKELLQNPNAFVLGVPGSGNYAKFYIMGRHSYQTVWVKQLVVME